VRDEKGGERAEIADNNRHCRRTPSQRVAPEGDTFTGGDWMRSPVRAVRLPRRLVHKAIEVHLRRCGFVVIKKARGRADLLGLGDAPRPRPRHPKKSRAGANSPASARTIRHADQPASVTSWRLRCAVSDL